MSSEPERQLEVEPGPAAERLDKILAEAWPDFSRSRLQALVRAGHVAVDGTPVLDVKPWMDEFAPRGEVRQPAWSRELMSRYWA